VTVLLGTGGRGARCLLVWTSGTAAIGAAAREAAPVAVHGWSARGDLALLPLDRALAGLAAAVLLGCAAWAWLALTATVVEALRGACHVDPARVRPWHLTGALRRGVLAACGVVLVSGALSPGVAAEGPRHPGRGAAVLAGLPLPDRAVAPPLSVRPPGGSRAGRSVVVRSGDCLWTIAERGLPARSSGAVIEARWRAIYAANRALIGPDPDLLMPGQRLLLPRKAPS
jgi:hypothetical protein